LQAAGRALVGEGVLIKMCRKKPKPRQFFLFNDILVYGNIVINKKKVDNMPLFFILRINVTNCQFNGFHWHDIGVIDLRLH